MAVDVQDKAFFRPISVTGVADSAVAVCRRAPAAFLALSLLVNLPAFAAIAALHVYVRDRGATWGSLSYFLILGILSLLVAGALWLRAVGTGALAFASVAAISRGEASALGSLRAAFGRGATLGVLSALRLVFVGAGLVVCVIPGVHAFGALAIAPHAALLENLSLSQAVVRSAKLSPRAAGGLFAATLLALIVFVVGFAEILLFAQLAVVLAGAVAPTVPTSWLGRPETAWNALAITKIITDPLVSASTSLAWLDARIRSEGLDLELRSQVISGEPLAIDPAMSPA